VLKKFSNSSYLFAPIRKNDPVCFVVLRVSVLFFVFVKREFSDWVCGILVNMKNIFEVFVSVSFDLLGTEYVRNMFSRYLISHCFSSYGWCELLGITISICMCIL
jgi:hypothetical protein